MPSRGEAENKWDGPGKLAGDLKETDDLLHMGFKIAVVPVWVFIRGSPGCDWPGGCGLASTILLLWYACYRGSPGLQLLWAGFMVMLCFRRLGTFINGWRGRECHSLYSGYPWLGMLIPFVRREATARLVEIPLCLLAAALLSPVDEPLGHYLVWSSFALAYIEFSGRTAMKRRMIMIKNQQIEAGIIGEYMQGRR